MFARFRLPLLLVVLALCYGTIGYRLVERMSVLDAFYTTVLTLSTVGVGRGPGPSVAGKWFTISLILFGVAALFVTIGVVTEVLASGELGRWLRRKRMTRRTGRLSGHYVICAYGRVGRAVTQELRRQQLTAMVIESRPEVQALLEDHNVPYILGDPADEAVLKQAGVERARGLVAPWTPTRRMSSSPSLLAPSIRTCALLPAPRSAVRSTSCGVPERTR